jgi:uncharacterized damage-inducible protein DinB
MEEHLLPIPNGYDGNTQRMVAMFAAQFNDQLDTLIKAVDGMTTEQLEWQLQPGMNTIGILLAHIAVAEAFWINVAPKEISDKKEWDKIIREIVGIGGEDDGLPLPENGTHPETLFGKSSNDYIMMLGKCRTMTHKVLQTWKDDDLDVTYTIEAKYTFSLSWTLYHVLEHLSSHLGQVLLLKHIMRDKGIVEK